MALLYHVQVAVGQDFGIDIHLGHGVGLRLVGLRRHGADGKSCQQDQA